MPPDAGYLYAIQAEGTPYVKIGQTTTTVEARVKALQTGQPFPLTILAAIKIDTGLGGVERQLHQALASQRRTGEWFELTLSAEQFLRLVEEARAHNGEEHATPGDAPSTMLSRKRTTPIPPEVMHMADRVYMLRHAKRLTQSELAQAAGCSTATISDLETKKLGTVDIANLVALARVLETTPNDLLGFVPESAA